MIWGEYIENENKIVKVRENKYFNNFNIAFYYLIEKSESKEKKEEPSSVFQRQRVDLLLGELAKKFPPKIIAPPQHEVKGRVDYLN